MKIVAITVFIALANGCGSSNTDNSNVIIDTTPSNTEMSTSVTSSGDATSVGI